MYLKNYLLFLCYGDIFAIIQYTCIEKQNGALEDTKDLENHKIGFTKAINSNYFIKGIRTKPKHIFFYHI